jgi:hypothetical protein
MSLPLSRLTEIFDGFHNQICRIDDLERRIDERAVRSRRRVANLLDHSKPYRNSHLRLFVTHQHAPPLPVDPEQPPQPKKHPLWTMHIEGKLLIDHLDHAGAAAFDAKTGYTPPTDDLDRSRGEKEEEEVQAIQFTHFFDKVAVQFYTVYQPKQKAVAPKKKTPAKKSSRRGSKDTAKSPVPVVEDREVDPRLLTTSEKTELICSKAMMTEDALAFAFQYPEAPPTVPGKLVHSVVASIQLFPADVNADPMYQASPELASALFPSYGPEPKSADKFKKRKADDMSDGTVDEAVALENEIAIPQGLTMKEITVAFFTYIQDRMLCDEADKSVVVCDKLLEKLFETERFPFSQLRELLFARNLVREISTEPLRLTYIMKEDAASPDLSNPDRTMPSEDNPPGLLQLDTDVAVPALFPYRTRELLRRIKRRELEYTSSRTKARYMLMSRRAKDEEAVKLKIDQVVSGRQLGENMQPVMAALSKSAPPNTEARTASHLDVRMSYLLGRLREHHQAALAARELAEACRTLAQQPE